MMLLKHAFCKKIRKTFLQNTAVKFLFKTTFVPGRSTYRLPYFLRVSPQCRLKIVSVRSHFLQYPRRGNYVSKLLSFVVACHFNARVCAFFKCRFGLHKFLKGICFHQFFNSRYLHLFQFFNKFHNSFFLVASYTFYQLAALENRKKGQIGYSRQFTGFLVFFGIYI